ncbi:type VI secretion system protein TssA [Pseudomonas sp. EL_65y_Pfl2_R95]|uniref:type VI secretion system protein TssA n=1 Tax=Pseudomonas sp. EL_65y_Pfl2_R95 TaxID=3088698 RepID=UPI0030DCD9C0
MTISSTLSARYYTLANKPISADNFAGSDIRYSTEYEHLETELRKANSLHAVGTIDWQKVLESSEVILNDHSKDIRVSGWLVWALYQRESFTGLHAGIVLLHALCTQHWNELYPLKARTRAAAISWLTPRLEQVLAEDVPVGERLKLFGDLATKLRELEGCLSEQLGADAPLLLPLCRRLEEQIKRASQTKQDSTKGVAGTLAQVKQTASSLLTSATSVDGEKDAHKQLRHLQDQSRPLCAYWLKQKASDVRALRLSRTLLWLPIDSLPERNAEKVTALRGLPVDKLKNYQERYQQGQYADLLVELETSIARAPFWLDGQHLAWQCLQGLNAETAALEIEIQLALFMQRMNGLELLQFHDATPFADEQTRAWLSSHVMPHVTAQQPPSAPVISSGEGQTSWDEALQDALPLLRKEGLKPAVQRIKKAMESARGGRESFFWQLTLARLCFTAKKYDLAKTQLDTLDQLIQSSGIAAWEPDLALEVVHMLHSCCELLPQNHAVREYRDEIYRRLCHLDLEVVLD